jgi:glutamine synthetase
MCTGAPIIAACCVGEGQANRVEYRAAGADANPYLIIAALLAAGADGLERQLDPGPAATGDQYADHGNHAALPATFADGLHAYEGSALASALGPLFSENLIAMTRNELALYEANANGGIDDVTDWEFARYVEFS